MNKENIDKLRNDTQELLSKQSEAFQDDVMQGLDEIMNQAELDKISAHINHRVSKKITKTHHHRINKVGVTMPTWLIIFIVLLIIVVTYMAILLWK